MAQQQPKRQRKPWFISWRWRLVIPLAVVLALTAMVGAYAAALHFSSGLNTTQDNLLLEGVRGLSNRTDALYRRQFQEAQRVAFTIGVPEAVARAEVDVLQDGLEASARVAELDALILTDANGIEVLGVQRVSIPDVDDYAVNSGTALTDQPLVVAALGGEDGAAGPVRTPEGVLVFVSAPMRADGQVVGAVLAGNNLSSIADAMQDSAVTQIALFSQEGELLQTTFELDDTVRRDLTPDQSLMAQALGTDGRRVPVVSQGVAGVPYRAAYAPLNYGNDTLGVVALFLPDSIPFATSAGRQLTALLAAGIAGAAVMVAFVGVGLFITRVERVQKTAVALARGQATARTNMRATDEPGVTGAALDAYANRVQRERDAMLQALQRQRREANHFAAVLQSMPDGVLVQDNTGQITFINDVARHLLAPTRTQTQTITQLFGKLAGQQAGAALAPGIYALGDPQRVEMGEKMINAQAALIRAMNGERIGTVVVMRDVTETVRQEQKRERLLKAVEHQVQAPLDELAQESAFHAVSDAPMDDFAREIAKRAIALRKLVAEMRELTTLDEQQVQRTQTQIRLDTLVWTVANEWRQIAQAAELGFRVVVERSGLHVLGDERRLRWAIGNVLDNAIKYTPPGGMVTLEVNGMVKGQALLRVRDNGVGIADSELMHVTTRFYRGNPTMKTGEIIRTPGMGQGLHTAEQIFQAHGGFLRVRSKVGVGTAVYFSVPITSSEALDLPGLMDNFEGETVQLPEDYLPDLKL